MHMVLDGKGSSNWLCSTWLPFVNPFSCMMWRSSDDRDGVTVVASCVWFVVK